MKQLNEILRSVKISRQKGDSQIQISNIAFDSRKVEKGGLFIACKGTHTDGHQYIEKAIENGASAIICEQFPNEVLDNIVYFKVENTTMALGIAASNYYGNPSSKLKLTGITGTNGKTTTVTLLYRLFSELGYKAGLLSTIRYFVHDKEIPATHTTPDALTINKLLLEMVEIGCDYCFMEVSSHSVSQNRIAGLEFTGAIFSNITHDHLDYHETFDNYLKVKKAFFDSLDKNAFALVNKDDINGMVMLQNCDAQKYTYAIKSMADFKCRVLETHFEGTKLEIDNTEMWSTFIGDFNAYNILTVYSTAMILGQDKNEILEKLSAQKPVHGRFETIRSKNGITAIIDYAHTPDALLNVLKTINQVIEHRNTADGEIITVVGAGGDRDKTKRPVMAKVAAENSNKTILTSDNPRSENPEDILSDMQKGLDKNNSGTAIKIVNRREAIKTACLMAKTGDIILIAGKGHEDYQEVNGVKHHFDDKEEVINCFTL